ncbi:oxidoreductase [Acrocarpospora corrugata]|uniref:Oxidoreductase n=1 Tax=Acrocarpospora corrugata TaxID=35763 RepID=A0A5M3VQS7_9ACTN|nr:Gfo/Idh/MocA family oxidoreductase [Acrocarpospora corrugata]GER98548.1 oxidoreductase [Acrocarpospora corrugata]
MDEIKVGLAGFGPAGSFFHAPLIAATPGLRLAAVVTRDPAKADRVSALGAAVVGCAEELWERSDLIVIASPNRTHVPLATAALTAGLPVVVDKPLAGTAAEAAGLIRLAREKELPLTVFQNRRWDGDFLTIRRLGAELGEIRRFESRFERWRPVPKGGWRERGGPDEIGGLLYDLGSHLVDQALELLGPVTAVYAETDVRRAEVEAEDDVFLSLTHLNGARSQLWMSAVAGQLGPRFRVVGAERTYVKWGLDRQEDRLRAGDSPGLPEFGEEPEETWGTLGVEGDTRKVRTEPGAYADFYRGVVAMVREKAAPPVDPAGVVAALAVLEAAKVAASEQRVVSVPQPGA